MATPNRVSALIQTLEQSAERTSRASLSRSPSRTPTVVTPEKPRSPSLRGDITADATKHNHSWQENSAATQSIDSRTMTDEKEVASGAESQPRVNAHEAPSQRPPAVELCEDTPQRASTNHSRTPSERSDSSFASPFVLANQDHMQDDPFHRPRSHFDVTEWLCQPFTEEEINRHSIVILNNELPPSLALQSHPPEPMLRRSATVPPRRPTSFVPTPLDTSKTVHWGIGDVLGTPYPSGRNVSATMPDLRDYNGGLQGRTICRPSKQSDAISAGKTGRPRSVSGEINHSRSQRPKESSLLVSVRDSVTNTVRYVPLYIPRQGPAAAQPGHDDEELAYRMRDSYLALRGPWKTLFVARSVVGIALRPKGELSNQPSTPTLPQRRSAEMGRDVEKGQGTTTPSSKRRPQVQIGTSQFLHYLYHNPNRGRETAHILQAVEAAVRSDEDTTLHLIEGWNVSRIGFALAVILLGSIAATLAWTFYGAGARAHIELLNAASAGGANLTAAANPIPVRIISRTSRVLSSLPADRMEPAAILGALVLFLGWTGVLAWMGLSYLVT